MSRESDRDRSLERLLRTSLDEPPGAVTAACVDAERLAAWSDGGLSPAEQASIEAHVSSCARCLAMLAVLADTVPPVVAEPFWRRSPARWLVPLVTGAAAVLIWTVLPARPPAPAVAPTTQVARDEFAPAAPTPQRFDAPAPNDTREAGARSSPAPAENERRREQSIDRGRVSERPAQESAAKAEAGTASQRAANDLAMADRMAQTAPPPPPAAAAREAPAAPPAGLMRTQTMTIEIRSPDPAQVWRIVGAPDPQSGRVGGQLVERSVSGGSAWQPAVIPAGLTVSGGTSPAPNICWLIGPAGTVLRTTTGLRFEAVSIPKAGTLVSVSALDANQAIVTAADGVTYSTTDGGKTWTRN